MFLAAIRAAVDLVFARLVFASDILLQAGIRGPFSGLYDNDFIAPRTLASPSAALPQPHHLQPEGSEQRVKPPALGPFIPYPIEYRITSID